MGRRRQNAEIGYLFRWLVVFVDHRFQHPQLVIPEVVDHDQQGSLALADLGRDDLLEEPVRQNGSLCAVEPVPVVFLDEFEELGVRLLLLALQDLCHSRVGYGLQLNFPVHQLLVQVYPVFEAVHHGQVHRDLPEFLLVVRGRLFGNQPAYVQVLFQAEQDLVWIHGLDQVIGDLRADGLLHDVFLLALGDHDHGKIGKFFLDLREGFQAGQSGHVLVQENDVEALLANAFNGVRTIGAGYHLVILFFQK